MNRVLPLVPNNISKGDKTVKVVNNYEPLTSNVGGDTSQKFMKSEFPSRGDSLKHKESNTFNFKDKLGMGEIDDSSPMKPVPPAPPL